MPAITSRAALRAIYPQPKGRTISKQLDHVDAHGRRFIAASPFLLLGTAGTDGSVDVSPKGDAAGFVQVEDDHTLLVPDRPGNNRLDGLENLLERPGIALIFLIPGVDETYRVTGTAEIRDDDDLRARFEITGKRPATVLKVTVTEAFLHCAKALMRSRLWQPESWAAERPVASMGEMLRDQTGGSGPIESQTDMVARYRGRLY